jgi:hypothetical protein
VITVDKLVARCDELSDVFRSLRIDWNPPFSDGKWEIMAKLEDGTRLLVQGDTLEHALVKLRERLR